MSVSLSPEQLAGAAATVAAGIGWLIVLSRVIISPFAVGLCSEPETFCVV